MGVLEYWQARGERDLHGMARVAQRQCVSDHGGSNASLRGIGSLLVEHSTGILVL